MGEEAFVCEILCEGALVASLFIAEGCCVSPFGGVGFSGEGWGDLYWSEDGALLLRGATTTALRRVE